MASTEAPSSLLDALDADSPHPQPGNPQTIPHHKMGRIQNCAQPPRFHPSTISRKYFEISRFSKFTQAENLQSTLKSIEFSLRNSNFLKFWFLENGEENGTDITKELVKPDIVEDREKEPEVSVYEFAKIISFLLKTYHPIMKIFIPCANSFKFHNII